MGFVHLHTHTEYSLLDGASPITRLLEQTQSLGQNALAITDHGVMFGVVEFYKQAKKRGINPIIGCEVYVARRTRFDKVQRLDASPYHLILLCKNNTGYQNLIKLVSAGFVEGFYNKPRVDRELLEKYHEGLICLSACLAGEIPRLLVQENFAAAVETAKWYRNLFGAENYYIELQNHGIHQQQRILPLLARVAEEAGVGLAATNDVHYITKEDSQMQKTLLCIQTNTTLDAPGDMEFETEEFYLKSEAEMTSLFGKYQNAIENTQKIADQCHVEFTFGQTVLPFFQAPTKEDNTVYFRRLCTEGLHEHYGKNPDQSVLDRLEYELSMIERMGYVDYFLIVADFISYAKSKGIPVGPGRGSGAGSLAAYCIGITGIDPLRYQLIFERFLNPERVSMPDFDIDFCYERRGEVIDYVVQKYGRERVAQIITFGTMAARGAIRDVGRVMGLSYGQVDAVAKQIPNELKMTLEKAEKCSFGLRELMEKEPQTQRLVDMAKKIEGMPRHASTHAAGVVITRNPVDDYVPLYKSEGSLAVTQFPMTTLEELGLLKMDFLGLRTLTVIEYAQQEIRKSNPDFDIEAIPMEDPATFALMEKGQCLGVFQFESSGMRSVIAQLHPTGIEDLIAVISLYRPGPMDSIPTYIRNRHNPALVTYKHPLLRPILDVTYGCIVYQEQVMQICRDLGGYSYGRADLVRRAMSKKKHDVMEQERTAFVNGAADRGVPVATANDIFNEMTGFASYAFNKSHAAAYAVVAYRTAYLKAHFPAAFMAALLTSVLDNTDKVIEYIAECNRMGIDVLPPDVNESGMGFTVVGNCIRFGLLAVKNVGRHAMEGLLADRAEKGRFSDFISLCERLSGKDFNRRVAESLVRAGACDGLCSNRNQMLRGAGFVLEALESSKKDTLEGQLDFFSQMGTSAVTITLPQVEELSLQERLRMEKEATGLYISGHPLKAYTQLRTKMGCPLLRDIVNGDVGEKDGKIWVLALINSVKLTTTRKGDAMAFVQTEDEGAALELLVFPTVLRESSMLLTAGGIAAIYCRVSQRDEEEPKLLAERIIAPEALAPPSTQPKRSSAPAGLHLRFPDTSETVAKKVTNLLEIFDGRLPVYFYYPNKKGRTTAPETLWVTPQEVLLRELSGLLGQDNVRVILEDKQGR